MSSQDQGGFTVVELTVAMSLLLVALTMFTMTLWSAQTSGLRQERVGRANDAAFQALSEMDRQLRSGYVASENAFTVSGCSSPPCLIDIVRFYTEAYAPPSDPTGTNTVARCVAWAVVQMSGGRQGLYSVWWTPSAGGGSPTYNATSGAFTVPTPTGITNVAGSRLLTDELSNASSSTFTLTSIGSAATLAQRLAVTFDIRESGDSSLPWSNVVATTLAARNSPRSEMKADTGVYIGLTGSERNVLCA